MDVLFDYLDELAHSEVLFTIWTCYLYLAKSALVLLGNKRAPFTGQRARSFLCCYSHLTSSFSRKTSKEEDVKMPVPDSQTYDDAILKLIRLVEVIQELLPRLEGLNEEEAEHLNNFIQRLIAIIDVLQFNMN